MARHAIRTGESLDGVHFRIEDRGNDALGGAMLMLCALVYPAWLFGTVYAVLMGFAVVMVGIAFRLYRAADVELQVGSNGVRLDGRHVSFEEISFRVPDQRSTELVLGGTRWILRDTRGDLLAALDQARIRWQNQPREARDEAMKQVERLQQGTTS